MAPIFSAVLLLAAQATPDPAAVTVTFNGSECGFRAEGREIGWNDLHVPAADWASEGRPVELVIGQDTPYRCVGGAVFALQRTGYSSRSTVADPPDYRMRFAATVRLSIGAEGCTPHVNDRAVSMEDLRVLVSRWSANQPEVNFAPDPDSTYECVDSILVVLREMAGTRLGFIIVGTGNEEANPGEESAPLP